MTPEETADQLRRALTSLRDLRTRFEALDASRHEPIAVIGTACRVPGAADVDALWTLLQDGADTVTETPAERWDADALYDPAPEHPGTVATRWGGFLDDLAGFDAAFFGISPREAAGMDPQQRLLLEVAWEALEHAGQPIDRLAGTDVGVFVGIHSQSDDYLTLQAADTRALDLYSGTGTSHSVVAGRLSYLLDLHGPSLAVDTACSSSLVAVHLAVQSLRRGESSMAVVGGVNAILEPTFTIVASRMRMMSPTGRCRPFDAAADGFVRSEGCGVVVLKRLRDAEADGDRVLAVIRGSAVNQDGRSNGLTAPNSLSQERVIRAALDDARTAADDVGLIEAHGTGTTLGDPIEVEALAAVFGGAAPARPPVALGSVKANLGHAEGAAGVIALIKAVLCLRHGEVPPLVHFQALNPHIDLDGTPFVLPTARRTWPAPAAGRVAGVSSFGWSGTNAHVVLAEAPAPAGAPTEGRAATAPLLLPLSARSLGARAQLAASYRALLAADPETAVDVCAAAARRRSHHGHRLAVTGRTVDELLDQLDAAVDGEAVGPASVGGREARPALTLFVFPGQGSQWDGMARGLLSDETVFRAAVAACSEAMAPHLGWSMLERLEAGTVGDDVGAVQPALFAVQVGLAALWAERGVRPDAVVGHSMGEVAAAHIAGILDLDAAARVICRRSLLLQRVAGQGAMAVVHLDLDGAREAIAGHGGRLSVAVVNSPTSTVIAGAPDALDQVVAALGERDVFARRVKVDVASHSPQVDPVLDELVAELSGLGPRRAAVPFWSTVTDRLEDGAGLDAAYWARNLRDPVRFGPAMAALVERGHTRVVEISPHPVLVGAVEEALAGAGEDGLVVASDRRDSDEVATMAAALGALYVDGVEIEWGGTDPVPAPVADLPPYPWQREQHWIDDAIRVGRRGVPDDALLGFAVPVADRSFPLVWDGELDQVDADGAVPAAVLVELLARAADAVDATALTEVSIERRPTVADLGRVATQTILDRRRRTVAVHTATADGWEIAAQARLELARSTDEGTIPAGGWEAALAGLGAVAAQVADGSLVVAGVGTVHRTGPGVTGAAVAAVEGSGGSWVARVSGTGADGRPVVLADDVVLRPATGPTGPADWVHTMRWRPEPTRPDGARADARLLVVAEPGGRAAEVAAELASGWTGACRVVAGADVAAALADADRVVVLGALDGSDGIPTSVAELDRAEQVGPVALLDVIHAVAGSGGDQPIHVVSRGAWAVGPDDLASPAQAMVWGLGRAVAEERPELWGGLLDLDRRDPPAVAAQRVVAELTAGEHGTEAAWRGPDRSVGRLVLDPPSGATLEIAPDAACMITGGFGALGQPLADWLVAHGARRLVLLGRTELPPRSEWASAGADGPVGRRIAFVRHLEGQGVAVHVASVDVADEGQLRGFLDAYRAEGWPPIRSVFHTVTVHGGHLVDELGAEAMHAQLAPKVAGTWTLADALGDLDHLVLYSSIAATLPSPGQGAYAVANAFMESFAEALSARGVPTVAIGWPFWEGTDEVLDGEVGQRHGDDGRGFKEAARALAEDVGLEGIPIRQGLEVLGALVADGRPRSIVAPVDWPTFGRARAARLPASVRDLVAATDRGASPAPAGLVEALAEAEPDARAELVEAHVRGLVGEVVKLVPSRIDDHQPFGSLGFDSLLAIELRNRLDTTVGLPFSATVAWNYPTVAELSAHVLDRLVDVSAPASGAAPVPTAGPIGSDDDLERAAGVVRQLTDEEALAALLDGAGS